MTLALRIKKRNALEWVFEALSERPDFLQKKMFGCLAAYLGDRIALVVADKKTPWNGVLLPTEREYHASLLKQFPMLVPHPILRKWLYLDQSDDAFEEIVEQILKLILNSDFRFGVLPKPKSLKKKKSFLPH